MRLVYFGTADFAIPALEALSEHVVLVVTQPDKPSGRGLELKPSPVKRRAVELGLNVVCPAKSRDPEFVERVRSLSADVSVVAAYGQILSTPLLEAAKQGSVNLHGSILPEYRGAAPIQRAVQHGETETGVTLMQMDAGMDTGDIIAIERTTIGPDETSGELFERLAVLAGRMAADWLPRIAVGDYKRSPQDGDRATTAPKVSKAEARLEADRGLKEQYDLFRAMTPFPGAYFAIGSGLVRVTKARKAAEVNPGPGKVTVSDGGLFLGFEGGSMRLVEVQPEGKRRMSGTDFANGLRLKSGDTLLAVGG